MAIHRSKSATSCFRIEFRKSVRHSRRRTVRVVIEDGSNKTLRSHSIHCCVSQGHWSLEFPLVRRNAIEQILQRLKWFYWNKQWFSLRRLITQVDSTWRDEECISKLDSGSLETRSVIHLAGNFLRVSLQNRPRYWNLSWTLSNEPLTDSIIDGLIEFNPQFPLGFRFLITLVIIEIFVFPLHDIRHSPEGHLKLVFQFSMSQITFLRFDQMNFLFRIKIFARSRD